MFPGALSQFLKEGVSPNALDTCGRSPLHELCQCVASIIAGATDDETGDLMCFRNMAETLLTAGANVNAMSLSGKIPRNYIDIKLYFPEIFNIIIGY